MGKSLNELMGWPGPMTHRQFVLWNQYLDDQWNQPSRTDHYIMQAALEARYSFRKRPKNLPPLGKAMKIHFTQEGAGAKPRMSKEQATAFSKAKWIGAVGGNVRVVEAPSSLPPQGPPGS